MTGYTGGIGGLPHQPPSPDCAAAAPAPTFAVAYDDGTDELVITSDVPFFTGPEGIEFVTNQSTYLVGNGQYTVVSPTEARIPSATAYGTAVTSMTFWDSTGQNTILGTWSGNVAIGGDFDVVFDSGTGDLTITSLTGFDFTPVVTINYTGNGNGQITNPPWFTVDSPSQITVPNAAFALNGGVLTQLDFFVGPAVAATWTGAVLLA